MGVGWGWKVDRGGKWGWGIGVVWGWKGGGGRGGVS